MQIASARVAWGFGSVLALVALNVGCGKSDGATGEPIAHDAPSASARMSGHESSHAMAVSSTASALDEVARVHGGSGPWAVAGYRMGQYALTKLGLARQSFDLDVTHRGPLVPQYACVADGASAATGASLGKVNLRLEEADVASVLTVYRRKSTGQTLALRPTEAFKQRFLNVPREQLRAAGEQVLSLRDDEIFEEAPLPPAAGSASAASSAPAASASASAPRVPKLPPAMPAIPRPRPPRIG